MKISHLFTYPIKSLKPIELTKSELTPLGLKWDRHWMLINEQNQSITQRTHPIMGLFKTELCGHVLKVTAPDDECIEIPMSTTESGVTHNSFIANIWSDACQVVEQDILFSQWFSEKLGGKEKLRFVSMAKNHQRPQSKGDVFGHDTTTLFADAAPYLITTKASLDYLNDCLAEKNIDSSEMLQFRPNIVLENSEQQQLAAFKEHNTSFFKHQDYILKSCNPCQRCVVPTIDLYTAKKHPDFEPYKTLERINPMPNNPKAPAFGQNVILSWLNEGAVIKVSDFIEIIENQ